MEITLTLKAKGERALLLADDAGVEEWVPMSQFNEDVDPDYLDIGEDHDFDIKSWILREKGFIE